MGGVGKAGCDGSRDGFYPGGGGQLEVTVKRVG